jgi:membrane protease YdiL (CAAX protease family)
MQRAYLVFEFTLVFFGLPLSLRYLPWKIPPLPVLWAATGICLFLLLRDPGFDRSELWNPTPLSSEIKNILVLFGIFAVLTGAAVSFFAPRLLFIFVRANPALWALVMALYPVLSVYPQGVIYRVFLMHRYQPILGSPFVALMASAVAFSLMHIIFRNPLAIVLTFFGGALFAYRYQKTGSLCVSSFEHALYGCFLFTIGLGRYFYARAI